MLQTPMKQLKGTIKPIAIIGGLGLLAVGAAAAYWGLSQHPWCVRFASSGGQEVTYSWGCVNPQRYKKWVITASAETKGG